MISDKGLGITYFARGLKLIRKPEIRAYVLMPVLINFVLFGGLIWLGYAQFSPLVEWSMSFIPGFLDFLRWVIWLVITILSAIYSVFHFHTGRQYRCGTL